MEGAALVLFGDDDNCNTRGCAQTFPCWTLRSEDETGGGGVSPCPDRPPRARSAHPTASGTLPGEASFGAQNGPGRKAVTRSWLRDRTRHGLCACHSPRPGRGGRGENGRSRAHRPPPPPPARGLSCEERPGTGTQTPARPQTKSPQWLLESRVPELRWPGSNPAPADCHQPQWPPLQNGKDLCHRIVRRTRRRSARKFLVTESCVRGDRVIWKT